MSAQHAARAHLAGHCRLETRDSNHPRMQFHASPVRLCDGKSQRVIAGVYAVLPSQTDVPRLNPRRINHRAAHARLQQHGVDICSLQLVQQLTQFALLSLARGKGRGACARPVEAVQGGHPHSAHLALGGSLPRRRHGIVSRHAHRHQRQQQHYINIIMYMSHAFVLDNLLFFDGAKVVKRLDIGDSGLKI